MVRPARRRRDPYARQIPGVLALKPQPQCACNPQHKHEERADGSLGRCRVRNCRCLAWRARESSDERG